MKKCPKCGNMLNDYSTFCTECGNKLDGESPTQTTTKKCPKCGATVNSYSSFCPECGTNMNAPLADKPTEEKNSKKSTGKSHVPLKLAITAVLVVGAFVGVNTFQNYSDQQKSSLGVDTSKMNNAQANIETTMNTSIPMTTTTTPTPTTTTITTTTTPTPTTTTVTTTTTPTPTTTEKPKPSVKIPSGSFYSPDIEGFFLTISGSADSVSIKIRCDTYGSGGYAPYDYIKATGVYNYDTEEIEFSGTLEYVDPDPDSGYREVTSKNESGNIIIDGDVIWLTLENSKLSDGAFSGRTMKLYPEN